MKIIDLSLPIDDTLIETHDAKIDRISHAQGVEHFNWYFTRAAEENVVALLGWFASVLPEIIGLQPAGQSGRQVSSVAGVFSAAEWAIVDGTIAQAEELSFRRRFQRKANSRILKKN